MREWEQNFSLYLILKTEMKNSELSQKSNIYRLMRNMALNMGIKGHNIYHIFVGIQQKTC